MRKSAAFAPTHLSMLYCTWYPDALSTKTSCQQKNRIVHLHEALSLKHAVDRKKMNLLLTPATQQEDEGHRYQVSHWDFCTDSPSCKSATRVSWIQKASAAMSLATCTGLSVILGSWESLCTQSRRRAGGRENDVAITEMSFAAEEKVFMHQYWKVRTHPASHGTLLCIHAMHTVKRVSLWAAREDVITCLS